MVPVIAGQRRKIDGVIHGASSSGHTLFVEPLETIDLNNELVRLTEEEAQEVHRILRELTGRLRGYAESIRQTMVDSWASSKCCLRESALRFGIRLRHAAFWRSGWCCARRGIRCSKTCCAGSAKRSCRSVWS